MESVAMGFAGQLAMPCSLFIISCRTSTIIQEPSTKPRNEPDAGPDCNLANTCSLSVKVATISAVRVSDRLQYVRFRARRSCLRTFT